MLPPLYEGCISRLEQQVRVLLSNCESVWAFLGIEVPEEEEEEAAQAAAEQAATEALKRIYDEQLPEPPCDEDGNYTRQQLRDMRPFILVYSEHGTPHFIRRASNPSSTTRHYIADVMIELERETPEDYCHRPDWAYRSMVNQVGLIGQEAMVKSGIHPYPSMHRIIVDNVCTLAHPQEYERLGNYQWSRLRVVQEES